MNYLVGSEQAIGLVWLNQKTFLVTIPIEHIDLAMQPPIGLHQIAEHCR